MVEITRQGTNAEALAPSDEMERVRRGLDESLSLLMACQASEERYRRLAEEERAARESAEETVRLNELFVGILGHDLRAPLNAISMSAECVVRTAVDERQRKAMNRVLSGAARMTRMIEHLLDFTRLRIGGGLALDLGPADLDTLARETVEECRAAHPGHVLELHVEGNLEGNWDDDRLLQVFSNLLSNAIHHGAAKRPITIELDGRSADTVIATVHNWGPPIPRALLPLIFEPFRGRPQHASDSNPGLGLGLYITEQLVLQHEGSLEVESSIEDGTIFRVLLPRRPDVGAARLA